MQMTDEEILHIRELLDATKKRHDALEIQAAMYGRARVPAEIAVELRESEESLERLNAKLRIVTVPLDVQAATGPEASIDVLRLTVRDLKDQMGTMWRYLEQMILEDRAIREDRYKEQDIARRRGAWERRAVEIALAVGIGVAIYLAVHT